MDFKICQFCGKSFTIKDPSKLKRRKNCSRSCARRKNFNKFKITKSSVTIFIGDASVLVDREDLQKVNHQRWYLSRGYALNKNKRVIFLHHLIIGKPPTGYVTDHINRNRLDNRRCNLRFVTPLMNSRNCSISKRNTSGYTGVMFDKHYKKWRARLMSNNKNIFLGYYMNIEDAVKARKEAELKYWGKNYA